MSDRPGNEDLESDGIASLPLGPDWNFAEGAASLRSTWPQLERSPEVKVVRVVASSAGENCPQLFARDEDRGRIGPKTNGLLKRFDVIRRPTYNAVLELIAEADAVVATADATFADTSMFQGPNPVHALALKKMLPDLEVSRIALLGDGNSMPNIRAFQLQLIDALVTDDLESVGL